MSIFTQKLSAFKGKLNVHPMSIVFMLSGFGLFFNPNHSTTLISYDSAIEQTIQNSPPREDYFIRGFVKQKSGVLLKDIFVYLKRENQFIDTCKSDSLGMYEFVRLKPGDYKLIVTNSGYASYEDSIEIVGTDVFFDIELYRVEVFYGCTISSVKTREKALTKTTTATSNRKSTGIRGGASMAGYAAGTTATRNGVVGRGSRTDGTAVYVDGVRVQNNKSTAEEYTTTIENAFIKTFKESVSTFSSDVDYASYTNVRRMINNNEKPDIDAVRVEEFINYFDYSYDEPKDNKDISIKMEEGSCPWEKDHRLVKIGLKTKEIEKVQMSRNNLVFLIDVSGSMSSENKLPWVKYALKTLVNNLNPNDKVSIVTYAGYTSLALPSTLSSDAIKINKVIDGLGAGGSTAGGQGIVMAYEEAKNNFIQDGNNRIVLVTDGDFNVGITGETELKKLIEEKRKDGVYLTVCGFGMGNLKDSRMEMLADNGNGSYYYIDQLKEAERVFNYGLSSTLMTMAKDVKIQVEFNPKYVQAYRLIGYENRLLDYEDFKNDAKDAGDMGAGQTVTALYEIVPVGVDMKDSTETVLKYTKTAVTLIDSLDEILTLKIRNKKPKESTSIEISEVLKSSNQSYEKASNDFKLASGVALFGMMLRHSEYKGIGNYNMVLELIAANNSEKVKELIELVKKMEGIQ